MFCLQPSTFWTFSSMFFSCLTLETHRRHFLAFINYIHLTDLLKVFLFALPLSVWSFSIWKITKKGGKSFQTEYYASTQSEEIIWNTKLGFGRCHSGSSRVLAQALGSISKARHGVGGAEGLREKEILPSKYFWHFWNCSQVWVNTQTGKWGVWSWLRIFLAAVYHTPKHHGSRLFLFSSLWVRIITPSPSGENEHWLICKERLSGMERWRSLTASPLGRPRACFHSPL